MIIFSVMIVFENVARSKSVSNISLLAVSDNHTPWSIVFYLVYFLHFLRKKETVQNRLTISKE
jgi:hypothetical protein